MTSLVTRFAIEDDLENLQALIQRAYRGDDARAGWTHEADILEGERITVSELSELVASPSERVIVGHDATRLVGCVRVADTGGDVAYLGLLCVDPELQVGGFGRALIEAAEAAALLEFHARRIEMTVIEGRAELIAYYERRGYVGTGTRPFPFSTDPPLSMVVLEKQL